MFAVNFGEGAAAVVDLDGWGSAAGRSGVSIGDSGGARCKWYARWCMSQAKGD